LTTSIWTSPRGSPRTSKPPSPSVLVDSPDLPTLASRRERKSSAGTTAASEITSATRHHLVKMPDGRTLALRFKVMHVMFRRVFMQQARLELRRREDAQAFAQEGFEVAPMRQLLDGNPHHLLGLFSFVSQRYQRR